MSMEPAEAFGKYCGEKIYIIYAHLFNKLQYIFLLERKQLVPSRKNHKKNESFINKFEKRAKKTNKANLSIQSRRKSLFFPRSQTQTIRYGLRFLRSFCFIDAQRIE